MLYMPILILGQGAVLLMTPDGKQMYLTQCATDPTSPRLAQIVTSNFIWLPFESSVGIRLSYNTWDDPHGMVSDMLQPERFRTEFLFTIDM